MFLFNINDIALYLQEIILIIKEFALGVCFWIFIFRNLFRNL